MGFLTVTDAIREGRYVVPKRSAVSGVGQDFSALLTALPSIVEAGGKTYAAIKQKVPQIAVPKVNAPAPASGTKGMMVSQSTLMEVGLGVLGLGLLFVLLRRK